MRERYQTTYLLVPKSLYVPYMVDEGKHRLIRHSRDPRHQRMGRVTLPIIDGPLNSLPAPLTPRHTLSDTPTGALRTVSLSGPHLS